MLTATRRFILTMFILSFLLPSLAFARSPKKYQVTGKVLELTEDVIVVQVDTPNQTGSTFYVFDSDTGKIRKQFKLQDNERA